MTACSDACGNRVADDLVEQSGWTYLSIQRRYRCPACVRALAQVNAPQAEPALASEGGQP